MKAFSFSTIYKSVKRLQTEKEFFNVFMQNYQNASAKIAFFADEHNLNELNSLCHCENIVLKEVLFRYPVGLKIYSVSTTFELLENTLQHIIPFGIPQHLIEFHNWMLYGRLIDPDLNEPQVFTLESLSFGFIIWLVACGISLLGYIMEQLHIRLRRHLRTLIGLVLFLMLLYCRLNTCAYL